MTATYSPWAAEFILECIGAVLYLKRSRLLAAIFYFSAMSDFVLAFTFGKPLYWLYSWSQIAGKELLLVWLACSICGMFVAENRKSVTRLSAAFLSLGSAAMITAFASSGETLKNKLLDGEIAANFILLGFVAVGWISRRDRLDQAWKFIVAGFVLMVGSDLIFTALWTFWDGARHLYPLGAISAQIVWILGPLRSVRLPEFRQSLEKQFPKVEKVTVI